MNTLDDLRDTLERHADILHDTERYVRPVAVRARIRAVRRRRAAAVAVAAVLVLVGGVAAASVLRSPGTPQPASVLGVDVPATIDVLGFPYTFEETEELGEGERHQLDELDGERAITLVGSDLGDGSATLLSDGEPVARVRTGEASAAPLPVGGTDPVLEVRYDGTPAGARAGVAIYEATGELAAGVSNGSVVFRDTYAGRPLLGAAFSAPGESSVEFDADGGPTMRFVVYCDGPSDLWVNLDIDGEPGMAGTCGADGTADLAAGSSATLDGLGAGKHVVRVFVSHERDGAPADVDEVTVGAGVYVAGDSLEYAGRTWLSDAADTSPLTLELASEDLLLGASGSGDLRLTWRGELDEGGSDGTIGQSSEGSLVAGVLLAGDTYQIRATGRGARILTYRPE
ncbi:hypothetical protein GON03_16890 [Nocardioides sp. MAH-18]|uniref:Uncharacterized protein n=1 Tax=Nocardioides agri TaxID=2682843 RepID=A0A6L6XZV5_9ACTN|nr:MULTISPECIES: hypothetical protein [unclassified Nocardioides]MBA2956017.1 hypothetical protein [Nocardioides sp. CGMCC 1.13656]MVQ50865.1 hypothetical protein [Nocardioides sp. MAH-18]